jgi:hypothetical protein
MLWSDFFAPHREARPDGRDLVTRQPVAHRGRDHAALDSDLARRQPAELHRAAARRTAELVESGLLLVLRVVRVLQHTDQHVAERRALPRRMDNTRYGRR